MYMNKLQRGFTLLELMVTIAIVGIVATIALWDSSDMLEENRAENFLLDLKRNISFARAKATSSDSLVVVCSGSSDSIKANDETTCLNNWQSGSLFVFFDANADGIYKPGDNDAILRVMDPIPDTSQFVFSGGNSLIFNASGRITTTVGSFIYCPNKTNNENNKMLTISQSGTALYNGETTSTCN